MSQLLEPVIGEGLEFESSSSGNGIQVVVPQQETPVYSIEDVDLVNNVDIFD